MENQENQIQPLKTAVDILIEETLTERQLASVFGVSPATVAILRKAGKIPFVQISQQNRLYLIDDVRKFLRDNSKTAK